MLRRQQNERHAVIDSQNSCVCLSFKLVFKRQNFHVIATVVKLAEVSYIAAEDWDIMLLHIALVSLLLYAKLHHISPS